MTWIRWDVPTPRHAIIGVLAEALKVRRAEAHGLYCATCCGFGEHQPDGRSEAVTDSTLEGWAGWEGKRGRFAQVFRGSCVEDGAVKGWWRNEAVLREQERNRKRPGQGTRKATQGPRKGHDKATPCPTGANPVPSRGNGNVDGNEEPTTTTTTSAGAASEAKPHTHQSCMALLVERLYFGHRPSESDMATNGSILRNFAAREGFDRMALVIEGLARRRDRGELHGVGPKQAVSLKWLNSAKMDLNQLAVSEDAVYRRDASPRTGRGGTVGIGKLIENLST